MIKYLRTSVKSHKEPIDSGESRTPAFDDIGSSIRFDRNKKASKGAIAFCGTSGLPFKHGGFEKALDEITPHFVDNGFECEVFCRRSTRSEYPEVHKGCRLIYVNGSTNSKLDTFISSIETGWYILRHRKRYKHALWFNNANIFGIMLTFLSGIPMSVNTDGLEWRRPKWSWPFKAYHIFSALMVSLLCRRLISDSRGMQTYYRKRFLRNSSYIPYGGIWNSIPVSRKQRDDILNKYGLKPGKYFLQITRFEPDNLPLEIAGGFRNSGLAEDGYKILIIGFKNETPYTIRIKTMSGKGGILILNALYDPVTISVLRDNCYCYVHGNSVGGTNPALLEAMAACPRIIAIDTVFNREVLGEAGIYFQAHNIVSCFVDSLNLKNQSELMRNRILKYYNWEEAAISYMRLVEGRPADYNPLAGYSRMQDILTRPDISPETPVIRTESSIIQTVSGD